MPMDILLRIDRWLSARATLVKAVTWTVFAIVIADYAHFIDLPKIVEVPAKLGIALTAARYALWEGVFKAKVLARVDAAREAAGDGQRT